MNIFATILLVSLSLIDVSNCSQFCDVMAFDNVFNFGHFVHMTRCGEVWTFDPRMNRKRDGKGGGGFIRDFSVYTFARKVLMRRILANGPFNKKYFRFAIFFFAELECGYINEVIGKDCQKAVDNWNFFGVIVGNTTTYPFKYNDGYEALANNELDLKWDEPIDESNPNTIWPDIKALKTGYFDRSKAFQHSFLFSPLENVIYFVLRADDEKHYCVTYVDVSDVLYDSRKSPKRSGNSWEWATPHCFPGHVVGMFYNENEKNSYIVGRIPDSIQFEDQVYTLKAPGKKGRVEIAPLYKDQIKGEQAWVAGTPVSLGTYFGCPYNSAKVKPVRKRSIDEKEIRELKKENKRTERPMSFESVYEELKDDWIQVSLMSFIALFLLFLLYKYQRY